MLLFAIVFCETGLVITPFLPGDSLLFVAGALASTGSMDVFVLFVLLAVAAILGDTLNYWIGSYAGPKVFHADSKYFKKQYLNMTYDFYEKYGNKTIILARFVPIVRTFAPFVAGIGKMNYFRFLLYNIVGGLVWVTLFVFGGYFFGNIPFVKNNFTVVLLIIIFVSFLPGVWEYWKAKRKINEKV